MRFPPVFLSFLLLTLAACSFGTAEPERIFLKKVDIASIKGWEADNHVEPFGAFLKSCAAFATMRDSEVVGREGLLTTASVWKELCRKAVLLPAGDELATRKFFEDEFIPFRLSSDQKAHALLTGYYEPLLSGSRTQSRPFLYPVYHMPDFPVNYSREDIDHGALQDRVPIIAYVDDPVQLFFLHVQGSGSIQLNGSGEVIRVGYAGSNGKNYTSIGKILVEKGMLKKKDVTMQSIRQWLYDHPKEMWQTLWQNPSYIFFQELNGGPYGAQRVALTPNRSLAVDRNYIPLGMPVFMDTVIQGTTAENPFIITRRLMIAQDTGSAIRGPMRGDIFFGSGYAAGELAGRLKSGGDLVLLLPRALARKIPDGFFASLFNTSIWQIIPPDYNIMPKLRGDNE